MRFLYDLHALAAASLRTLPQQVRMLKIVMSTRLYLREMGRPFLLLWIGHTVSLVGSSLTSFAMGIWIYQHTGKALDFAGMAVATTLPLVLLAPWAGTIADRIDRRRVILVADGAAALCTGVLAALLWRDSLDLWHLYLLGMVSTGAATFQTPAYQALIASVLPVDQVPRASGLMGISGNMTGLLAPSLAAALMGLAGLQSVVMIDLVTFCLGTVLALKVFSALAPLAIGERPSGGFVRHVASDFTEVLRFFKQNRPMLALLGYFTLQSSLIGLVIMMLTPLVLSEHTELDLARVMTTGALGGVLGSSLLVFTQRFSHRLMRTLVWADALLSAAILVAGLFRSIPVYLGCALVANAAAAVAGGLALALWMRNIPTQKQGRVFAFIGLVSMLAAPLVALAGGFLADEVFGSALVGAGAFTSGIGGHFGVGNGAAMSLVFTLCGSSGLLVSLIALAHPLVRSIDGLAADRR